MMNSFSKSVEAKRLEEANISFGVVVIPTVPIKEEIASASSQITKYFDNANIIDNKQFPAHLSLYLGGTSSERIGALIATLEPALSPFLTGEFVADRVYEESRGFIGVACQQSETLLSLVTTIVNACGTIHQESPHYRPHIIKRWPRLSEEQQRLLTLYGTYKTAENFDAHLSVASVPALDAADALQIARQHLHLPRVFRVEAFQLVDIGHNNEKWNVLYEWDGAQ
jgi:hypothetical protein